MHRKTFLRRTAEVTLLCGVCLLFWPGLLRSATTPATHYVWCGAAGAATGADWTNAFTSLPSALVRGDTYSIAGSTACTYPVAKLDDADSGTLVITARKAKASLDSGVAGWQASFETAQAKFTEAVNPDPETLTGNKTVVTICSSYYTLDGITGNSDPSSGGPSGYGFLLQTQNALALGILTISSNGGCIHPDTAHTKITVNGTEMDGVNTYAAATVSSCSLVGSTVTTSFSPTPTWTLIVGDQVDAFTNSVNGPLTVTDGSGHTASRMSVTSVTGSPNTSIAFTLTSGYVGNPCTQASPVQFIGLSVSGATPLYIFNAATDSYSNITVSNSYLHNSSANLVTAAAMSNVTFTKDFFANNGFTPTNHGQGVQEDVGSGVSSSNVTFSYNWWKDVFGTGFIAIFNQGSGALQTDSNWNIYGNVFWHTNPSGTFSSISGWIRCFGVSTQPVACSHFKIYNNTVYNLSNSTGHANLDLSSADPSSTDWEVYDNLWAASANVQPNVLPGNTPCFDETAACASTSQIVQDFNFYDGISGTTSSDVHGQFASTAIGSLFVNALLDNFNLLLDTNNLLNTSTFLPANSTDAEGHTRGAGGIWDAGALQFVPLTATKPNPPTNLRVVSVQ